MPPWACNAPAVLSHTSRCGYYRHCPYEHKYPPHDLSAQHGIPPVDQGAYARSAECRGYGSPTRCSLTKLVRARPARGVPPMMTDRESVVEGKSVDLGGRRIHKKK